MTLNRILLARDFSPVSDHALRYALDLAQRTGSELHMLYARVLHEDAFAPDDPPSPSADVEAIRDRMQATGGDAPRGDAVPLVDAVERDVAAGPAILRSATDHNIALIVMGTHGRRGVRRMLLGSVAEEVVRHADRPVMTVRGTEDEAAPAAPAIDRILVPVDFSEPSRDALHTAQAFAGLYGARLDVLHVIEDRLHPAFYVGGVQSLDRLEPRLNEKVADALDDFVVDALGADALGADAEAALHVVRGRPVQRIPEFVEDNGTDLVALSTHGQTGLQHFLMGSVAQKVVRHVGCPVLTVKGKTEHAE